MALMGSERQETSLSQLFFLCVCDVDVLFDVIGGWMTLDLERGAKETLWLACTFSCRCDCGIGGRRIQDVVTVERLQMF